MKKTIIITSLAIFFLGCNNKATDKINTDSSTKNKDISTETSENNSENEDEDPSLSKYFFKDKSFKFLHRSFPLHYQAQ